MPHEALFDLSPIAGRHLPRLYHQLLLSSVQGILAGFRAAELLSPGFHSDLIMGALSSETMALALPILAALPYTASFIDDVKSGFIKEYLPRTTVPRGRPWAAPFPAG